MRDPFIWSQSCGSLDELAILLTWLTALKMFTVKDVKIVTKVTIMMNDMTSLILNEKYCMKTLNLRENCDDEGLVGR